MIEAIIITVCLLALALIALVQERRATRAERACEELKAQVMRGATVAKWWRRRWVRSADDWYYHVKTSHGDLLLTEEQFKVARDRAEGLL